jgi:hypothetical protein
LNNISGDRTEDKDDESGLPVETVSVDGEGLFLEREEVPLLYPEASEDDGSEEIKPDSSSDIMDSSTIPVEGISNEKQDEEDESTF